MNFPLTWQRDCMYKRTKGPAVYQISGFHQIFQIFDIKYQTSGFHNNAKLSFLVCMIFIKDIFFIFRGIINSYYIKFYHNSYHNTLKMLGTLYKFLIYVTEQC